MNRHIIERNVESEFHLAVNKFEKTKKKIKHYLKNQKAVNLWGFKGRSLRLSIYALVIVDSTVALKGMISFLESGIGYLQQEYCDFESLEIELDDEFFEIDGTKKRGGKKLFDWWGLYGVARILRQEHLTNKLYSLFEECQKITIDPFWRRSMDLILMIDEKKDYQESIISDIESIANYGLVEFHGEDGSSLIKSDEGKDILKHMWLPIMKLYHFAYQKNELEYNKCLEKYLHYKKDWIIKNKEQDNSSYWIDFPVLGCCAYATDQGINITIETEYAPKWVYERRFSI